tara:strand:- start:82 stop:417 length:336 start_codon:yes stop_codon:yes gene_type:complete
MYTKLTVIIAFMTLSVVSYSQSTARATARVFEAQNKKLSRIVLVYETGESEVIPLEPFKFFGVDTDNVLVENQKTINKLINDMANKGYEIEHVNTTGEAFFYSLIIFKKEG